MNPIFSAIVHCVVGCNIGAPDGQTLHLLRCDTETGAMSLVQTVKGVQGTNYFCFDRDCRNIYTYFGTVVDGKKRGTIVRFPFENGKIGEMVKLVELPCETPCHIRFLQTVPGLLSPAMVLQLQVLFLSMEVVC